MKRHQLFIALGILVLSIRGSVLVAQTTLYLTTHLIQDGNAFQTSVEQSDWINNSTFYIGHRFSGESFELTGYYNADVLFFTNNAQLNNYAHKVGISGALKGESSSLRFSASARLRDYKETYAYYNVDRYHMNMYWRCEPDFKYNFMLGFTLSKDQYEVFDDLDNQAYRVNMKVQRFFQSRWSIAGETGFGLKNYTNQSVFEYFGTASGQQSVQRFKEEPVRAMVFDASVNIAKSLASLTGISLGLGGQWFVGDPIAAYSNGIYYFTENDLFDDPYSYEGIYGTLQLTQQFSVGFQAKAGLKVQQKDYTGTPALDGEGELTGEHRRDRRDEYYFMVSKRFRTGWQIPSSIGLFFHFIYRNNPSNDPYYDYKDHIGTLGFSVGI